MDYKSGQQGLQNGAAFRDYKLGQKILQSGAKKLQNGAKRLQIGVGITNGCGTVACKQIDKKNAWFL